MQKQETRCLSYYMECAAECPPKAQNGTPDGAFPQIGHISLLQLAGKQNTERVWKVEAGAEHQGEQSNILFFPPFFFPGGCSSGLPVSAVGIVVL